MWPTVNTQQGVDHASGPMIDTQQGTNQAYAPSRKVPAMASILLSD